MADSYDVTVIGAGIAGLTAARELRRHGLRILILDKGRQVGGRMATRRVDGAVFDTGAQFFTAVSPEFRALVDAAAKAESVTPWYHRPSRTPDEDPLPVWRGRTGMTDLPKWMASELRQDEHVDLYLSTRLTGLERAGNGIQVSIEGTERAPWITRSVILTPPLPQAISMVPDRLGEELDAELRSLVYDPCLALLLSMKAPIPDEFNEHGWIRPPDSGNPIAWVADNAVKGLPPTHTVPAPARLTIHSSPAAARRLYDDDQHATAVLAEALQELLPARYQADIEQAVGSANLKKWRFARPTRRMSDASVAVTPRIILAGDAFGGARVEGAFASGLHAAGRVLDETR
ncbi:MAG TPA: FAD-dependent oxidoreductase [Alkalispirochaeta sp.]|nr:FAD-dependent oxidoreductase [Alkalispirochaeta sp.]